MGGVGTYRKLTGMKSRTLRKLAATLSFSVVAISLSACQAPGNLAGATIKAPLHPPASNAATANALAILNKSDKQMIGLQDRDLTAALGEPNHVRHDEPATIWQYAADDCVLDFYLYKADAGMQVAYVEARDRKAQSEVTQNCVHSLLQPSSAAVQKTADAGN
jgi:hypothetical protein